MRRVDWLPEWTRQSERLLSLIEVSRPDAVMRNPGFFPYAYLDGEMEDPDSVAKIEHHLNGTRGHERGQALHITNVLSLTVGPS